MIIRNGFVSNSSSSSFMITNKTDKTLDLITLISEIGEEKITKFATTIQDTVFGEEEDYSFEQMIKTAGERNVKFKPGEHSVEFDDYDYSHAYTFLTVFLCDEGSTKSFSWKDVV